MIVVIKRKDNILSSENDKLIVIMVTSWLLGGRNGVDHFSYWPYLRVFEEMGTPSLTTNRQPGDNSNNNDKNNESHNNHSNNNNNNSSNQNETDDSDDSIWLVVNRE
jgi:hypothetical protein